MSDKQNNCDEAQETLDILPDGNAYERMRSFTRQREAILHPPDSYTRADEIAPPHPGGDKAEDAEPVNKPLEHQAVMNEYRRRQRLARKP
jgi:hypothetical protein